MLNVSGHLLSTAQVESAIVEHKAIAEAAAVSSPHPIKGECIYCFVVLHNDYEFTPELEKDIKDRGMFESQFIHSFNLKNSFIKFVFLFPMNIIIIIKKIST